MDKEPLSRLQELLDERDIRHVLSEYCHGCDRNDVRRMASVYAPDSWDEHGINRCSGQELAKRSTHFMGTGTEICFHQMGQSIVSVRGDEAGAETYFTASLRRREDNGALMLDQLGGRYVDVLRRTPEGWKIENRVCIREWSITHRIVDDWILGFQLRRGERSNADPAAGTLQFTHSGLPKLD